jgi:glycosyltransferase involved in cell wall biosynthesis
MRILVVIWSIQIGGAETFAVELCKFLKNRGYQPYLFPVFGPWDKKYYEQIRSSGIVVLSPFTNNFRDWISWKINALFVKLRLNSFRDWLTVRFFQKAITKHDIKLVISNALVADLFVAKNLTDETLHFVIEHGEYSYALTDKKEINWEGFLHADEIICVSEWCKKMVAQKSIDIPTSVIYNGHRKPSTIEEYKGKLDFKPDEFIFALVGRGIAFKGWEEAIKAYKLVKQEHAKCRLVLIGEGEFLRSLEARYNDVPGILFTGRLTKPAEVIRFIHVGLVPSQRYEAFGIVILDFFSQGKPVIATRVGGIPEVVNYDGKTAGTLVPVDENGKAVVRVLADQMIAMMHDHELYTKSAKQAAEIYGNFTFENTGRQYEKIIRKYLND